MADCTKTVEFIRELTRMCSSFNACSYGCPLHNVESDSPMCEPGGLNDGAIASVQKWSDEHPVMTWEGKLRELLPNADYESVVCMICPRDCFGGNAPYSNHDCTCNCDECWNGEYKEAET